MGKNMGNNAKSERARESKFVSAVVYLHNDEKNVPAFLDMLTKTLDRDFNKYELIFVNDASTDAGVARIYDCIESGTLMGDMISIVQMIHFQGLEAAMNAGRDVAIGDFVFEFDDLYVDYEPETLYEIYRHALKGFDIVSARSDARMRFTSRMFYRIYNFASRGSGEIGPETFRVLTRRAINRVKTIGQYIPYRKAVYMNCGLNADTIVYRSTDAPGAVTQHYNRTERTSLALDSFIYFTNILERVSFIISCAFIVITLLVAIDILVEFFSRTRTVEGWLSTMGFMSLGFMGVFILLTIILKYLSVLLNLVFKKQRYMIAGVEKIVRD